MFIHNFKYSLKTLFRNKSLIFWTFAFPIILGTLFNMAFSNIESSEKLDIIDIAICDELVIDETASSESNIIYDIIFDETFSILSDDENDNKLFNIRYVAEDEAVKLLDSNEISGYIIKDINPKIVVKQNGIDETILKQISDGINESVDIVSSLVSIEIDKKLNSGFSIYDIDYDSIYKDALLKYQVEFGKMINIKDISSNNLSYTMIEFYTLIAMACLYGAILGCVSINQNLANMSNKGKRVSVAPFKKWKIILSSILSSYITQLIGIAILFIYTIFVLKVDYGDNLLLTIILAAVGCLAGLSLGIFISTIIKTSDNTKTGIIISITMLCCFLSGMMGITMKYVIDKNVPIINKLNPANMIVDGFYSLYYYDTLDRYFFNLISLFVFSFILILVSFISLRRQKYDSI